MNTEHQRNIFTINRAWSVSYCIYL